MKKTTGIVILFLLVSFGYANAQQQNLGGQISPLNLKITYKIKVGSGNAKYGTFVTVNENLDSPYLYFVLDPSTGNLEKILVYASINGKETVIMGCTPELIGNSPPKKGLTFQVQGMADCTFCPESGVVSKDTCVDSNEPYAISYLTLSGTATFDNGTDQIVTKMVLKGTAGGGGFQYFTSDNVGHKAVLTGTFGATLEPMPQAP